MVYDEMRSIENSRELIGMENLLFEKECKKADMISLSFQNEVEIARKEYLQRAKNNKRVWVVLDDDPTGIQTVHDVAVYTDWEKDTLLNALKGEKGLFFILTNSRGITEKATVSLHEELMNNLIEASKKCGISFSVISRSDSTLRGHFPLETDIIARNLEDGLNEKTDGLIMIPFFRAGGRFTINDIHYVKYGENLVPAGNTEFALDETFGYKNSNLKKYIEEKTDGKIKAQEVISISLELLRQGRVDDIEEKLSLAHDGAAIVVNALAKVDLEVFCAALYRCIDKGKRYVFRTAADFVKTVGAVTDIPLLNRESLSITSNSGGVVMIGSHTDKTTRQLNKLRELKDLVFIEYDSDKILDKKLEEETVRVAELASKIIKDGRTPVIYTNRKVLSLPDDTKEDALVRSAAISEGFTDVVAKLECEPAFIVGKGGITSSDIGTRALKVKRALVLGQIQPGVPVWKTDERSRFPNIPYVIFPGNVGDDDTLFNALEALRR